MRTPSTLALAAGFVLGFSVSAGRLAEASEERTWAAHITDSMCEKEHMMDGMSDPECAVACREMGADYALFVPEEDTVYRIANQEKVEEFAGTDVTVTGVLGEDGATVTVVEITSRPE